MARLIILLMAFMIGFESDLLNPFLMLRRSTSSSAPEALPFGSRLAPDNVHLRLSVSSSVRLSPSLRHFVPPSLPNSSLVILSPIPPPTLGSKNGFTSLLTTPYVNVRGFRRRVAPSHCFACLFDISLFVKLPYSDFYPSGRLSGLVAFCRNPTHLMYA